MAAPQALIDAVTRNAVYIERLKAGEVKKFEKFLREIDKSIRERLAGDELTQFSRERLERLLVGVHSMLGEIFARHNAGLVRDLLELANYQAEAEASMITAASAEPENIEFVIPAPAQISAAVLSSPLSVRGPDGGKLLKPFLDDWSKAEQDALTGAIRQGYFQGQTNAQIAKKIRGTIQNKYRDGTLAEINRRAEAITRTAVQHAAITARMETLEANADITDGYRWVSTLDGRTSAPCRSLDGQVFKYGKGPRPPLHIRCRSDVVPELSDDFNWLSDGATRASNGPTAKGQTDANESYYEWLKRQPAEFQDETIGAKRGKLLRDGGITAVEFAKLQIDKDFKPITLEQMKKLNPLAFKRAGVKV
jgi:SPP1 gp7 family putative phage head morphogenesis protein